MDTIRGKLIGLGGDLEKKGKERLDDGWREFVSCKLYLLS